jgi:hypothetical protein
LLLSRSPSLLLLSGKKYPDGNRKPGRNPYLPSGLVPLWT